MFTSFQNQQLMSYIINDMFNLSHKPSNNFILLCRKKWPNLNVQKDSNELGQTADW